MEKSDLVTIRRARADEVVDLRHRVLRGGLARETAVFPGDDDPAARHFVAEREGRVVGTLTLHLNQWNGQPAWQLRGMAVDPTKQGTGVGAQLLLASEQSLLDDSALTQLWCNARVPAVAFYEKHGWTAVSDVFEVPTAGPHVKMIKRLSRSVR